MEHREETFCMFDRDIFHENIVFHNYFLIAVAVGVEVVDGIEIPDTVSDGKVRAAIESSSVESPDDNTVFNCQFADTVSRNQSGSVAV